MTQKSFRQRMKMMAYRCHPGGPVQRCWPRLPFARLVRTEWALWITLVSRLGRTLLRFCHQSPTVQVSHSTAEHAKMIMLASPNDASEQEVVCFAVAHLLEPPSPT
jgi:hypothetical protein